MDVLGIACFYHDASACLMRDGEVVAASAEERFTRVKHDITFPLNAILSCLDEGGITVDELDHIAHYEKPLLRLERALHQHIQMFPRGLPSFVRAMPDLLLRKLRVVSRVRNELGYGGDVLFIPHHVAHAAGAFLCSPFERAAILTVDGVGEWTTTAWGMGEGTEVRLEQQLRFPHSLGLLYSTITAYLGFAVNNSEYKVMGMAAFGNLDPTTNESYKRLKEVIDVRDDGSFRLDMRYFDYHYADRMPSDEMCELLGGPVALPGLAPTRRHKDIAAALQLLTEEVLTTACSHVHAKTDCPDLVLSGGVGLNCVFNGTILQKTPFERVWIPPDPGDGGTSMGAALHAFHAVLGKPRASHFRSPYLGPGFTDEQVNEFLRDNDIVHEALSDEDKLIDTTLSIIEDGQVVGWFQGRMEWGPRALGNRSILADPRDVEMKDVLNEKVKRREPFRPFAPAVCAEDAADWFDVDLPLPEPTAYMLMSYPVREDKLDLIPAAVHVDGTARLQAVHGETNPLFHRLIKGFGERTKVPVLVNTSFIIRGEPIVCTPEDAYRCMMGTGIDCTVIGRSLIRRDDNPDDEWDSSARSRADN